MTDINWKDLKVLIIDDEVFMQKLIQRILNDMGVRTVYKASNGAEGLDMLTKSPNPPDAIICDLNMPVMNGLMFTSKLRALSDPALNMIPLLVLTGHSETQVVEKAIKIGINGYVVKPVSVETLTKRLSHALKSPLIKPS